LILAGIIILGFVVRMIFFIDIFSHYGEAGFYPAVNEDAGEYISIAKNILHNGVFSRDAAAPFTPETFRTPGYPVFIALNLLFFKAIPFAVVTQTILWLLAVFFIYKLAILIFKSERAGLIAAVFSTFEPAIIYWNVQIASETLFTVLMIFGIYWMFLFWKGNKFNFLLLSAFFIGWANITRPIGEYLNYFYALAILIFFLRKNWRKAVISAGMFLVVINVIAAPLILRNMALYGSREISWASAVGFGKYLRAINIEAKAPEFETSALPRNSFLAANKIKEETAAAIVKYPLAFIKVHALSAFPFFLGDGYLNIAKFLLPKASLNKVVTDWQGSVKELLNFSSGRSGLDFLAFWAGKIFWALIMLGFVFGFIQLLREPEKRWPAVFLLAIIYYFFLATGVGSYSRFRFPVNPFIFLIFSYGINYALTRVNAKNR